MTAKEHNNLLGIFLLIQGGLTLLGGGAMVLIYGGVGLAMLGTSRRDEEQIVGGIMFAVGLILGIGFLVFATLYLVTGMKIRKQQPIGRTLGIVLSCLSL